MPTALLQRVQCQVCDRYYERRDMSPFQGICAACYDARFTLCTSCGAIMYQRSAQRVTHHVSNGLGDCGVFIRTQNRESDSGTCTQCRDEVAYPDWWGPTPLDTSFAAYDRIGSKRKFGVEIETASCCNFETLHGNTVFGVKTDPTISGREFDSPIMYGDEGLEIIEDFCAKAAELGWTADTRCGCHTHYDMRDESDAEMYRITYAYRWFARMWHRCVPASRQGSSYCRLPSYSSRDIRAAIANGRQFHRFAYNRQRYELVNLTAYDCHKTFEVRLLEGTVDAETICNWITAHCRFMDWAKNKRWRTMREFGESADQRMERIGLIVGDEIAAWLQNRYRRFNSRSANEIEF